MKTNASGGERELILSTVRRFVEKEVIPVASAMEHRDEYPHQLVAQMKQLGLFGVSIPEGYGGSGVDTFTLALICEVIAGAWLGLSGVIGTHSVMSDVVVRFGTEQQKKRFPPAMATGEKRGGICLTESNAGTVCKVSPRRRRASAMRIESTAQRCGLRTRVTGTHSSFLRKPILRPNLPTGG